MPELRTYNVFISHSWNYDDDYYRLEKLLDNASNFKWKNFSVPRHDSLNTTTDMGLINALGDQINPTGIVIILAGMYASHSKWIQREIDLALNGKKPIIAVEPWGQERTPKEIQDIALDVVGWNTSSIVSSIRTNSL